MEQPSRQLTLQDLVDTISDESPSPSTSNSYNTIVNHYSKPITKPRKRTNEDLGPEELSLKRQKQNEAARRCRQKKAVTLLTCQEQLSQSQEQLRIMTERCLMLERELEYYRGRDRIRLPEENKDFFPTS